MFHQKDEIRGKSSATTGEIIPPHLFRRPSSSIFLGRSRKASRNGKGLDHSLDVMRSELECMVKTHWPMMGSCILIDVVIIILQFAIGQPRCLNQELQIPIRILPHYTR